MSSKTMSIPLFILLAMSNECSAFTSRIAPIYSHLASNIISIQSQVKSDEVPVDNTPKINRLKTPAKEAWSLLVLGSEDETYGRIEQNQKNINKPYGKFLDAGTGYYSLRWLASLAHKHSDPTDPLFFSEYKAVTADPNFREDVYNEAKNLGVDEVGSVVLGNWQDPNFCEGEVWDTILLDYLIGSVDHFAPYYQYGVLSRLTRQLKSGGRMHLTGLEPIPYFDDNCEASNAFCKLSRVRDSCILLTGKRPYREYPMTWVVEELNRLGLKVLDAYKVPNTYTFEKVSVQADAARSTFPFFESQLTVEAMSQEMDRVEKECVDHCSKLEGGKFQLGFDWVITAEKQ